MAVGGAVDLVEKPEALASVKAEELPAELKGLKKEEQAAKVKQLAEERKVLEAKAAKLAADRDTWRAKNVAEKEDSLRRQRDEGREGAGREVSAWPTEPAPHRSSG